MDFYANASSIRLVLSFLQEQGLDSNRASQRRLRSIANKAGTQAKVSAGWAFDLLNDGADQAEAEDFGLRYGRWLNLRGLDTISLMWQHAASVAEWYELAHRYVFLENNALSYEARRRGRVVELIHQASPVLKPKSRHVIQAMMALTVRVFRELIDPDWAPVQVELEQERPRNVEPFEAFFRCPTRFSRERSALIVKVREFDRKLPGHNPELMAFLISYLKDQEQVATFQLEELVKHTILRELAIRPASIGNVAELLGMSSRSLQRQLHERGTTFSELLRQVRLEILRSHLALGKRTSLGRLADELGFSEASAASRFIRSVGEAQP